MEQCNLNYVCITDNCQKGESKAIIWVCRCWQSSHVEGYVMKLGWSLQSSTLPPGFPLMLCWTWPLIIHQWRVVKLGKRTDSLIKSIGITELAYRNMWHNFWLMRELICGYHKQLKRAIVADFYFEVIVHAIMKMSGAYKIYIWYEGPSSEHYYLPANKECRTITSDEDKRSVR